MDAINIQANTAEFKVQLDKFVKKAGDRCNQFFTEFSQNISEKISEATPVKTGFLRQSWHTTVNDVPTSDITRMTIGDVFGYVNTAVYARRVEFGFVGVDSLGRQYNQQPRSFVGDTIAKADVIADETLRDLR